MVLGLFAHTDAGAKALREVLASGIEADAVRVIGDLGLPAGQAGAMHHVTLDALHVLAGQRGRFMEGIREGGVVLAVAGAAGDVEAILRSHGADPVETTSEAAANPSHNDA